MVRADRGHARILGVDPGLNTTGYGVIDAAGGTVRLVEAGVIRTRATGSLESRLQQLHCGLSEVLRDHAPGSMAIEQLYSHYQRPRTAILMGHARGVICLCAAQQGIAVRSFEPTRVKRLLTGSGRSPKHQMQLAIKVQLNLASLPEPADVADALAIALCGYHYLQMQPLS